MRNIRMGGLACWILLGAACSSTHRVAEIKARPNVNLAKNTQSLTLKFGSGVQDSYTMQRENGLGPLEVSAWKASLATAFNAAFGDSFQLAPDNADLTLEIQEAELKMVPAAVAGDGYVVSGRGQIRFKAQLLDATGKAVARMSGSAESKTVCSDMDCAPSIAISAVETMYESVAEKLFATNAR